MAISGIEPIKDQVIQELDELDETELKQIADYIAFLKFRIRHRAISVTNEAELASLYVEFENEDRELAENGMSDYYEGLCYNQPRNSNRD